MQGQGASKVQRSGQSPYSDANQPTPHLGATPRPARAKTWMHSCLHRHHRFWTTGHLNEMVAAMQSNHYRSVDRPDPCAAWNHGDALGWHYEHPSSRKPTVSRPVWGYKYMQRITIGNQSNNLDPALETLLIDPQTCGPLLISVTPESHKYC